MPTAEFGRQNLGGRIWYKALRLDNLHMGTKTKSSTTATVMIKRTDAPPNANIAFIIKNLPDRGVIMVSNSMRAGNMTTFDYDYTGPIDLLIEYLIKCMRIPTNYTVLCNFGLEDAQATKETLKEYLTFMRYTGRTDVDDMRSALALF